MKILICSKLFYPSNRIGAVRPSNFAKYMAEFGHDVTVITENNNFEEDFTIPGVKIIRISNSALVKKLMKIKKKNVKPTIQILNNSNVKEKIRKAKNKDKRLKVLQHIYKSLSHLYSLIVEFDWYKAAKDEFLKYNTNNNYDIIISSFSPISSILLGGSILKQKVAKYWICDFRDNMISDRYPFWVNQISSNCERAAVKNAHALAFVSQGQRVIFLNNNKITREQKKKIHVIYNGYETKLTKKQSLNKEDNVLKITYTGQLYRGIRDFSLLFHVLDDLINEGKIESEKIQIKYAGQSTNDLNMQVNKFKSIKNICIDYGLVSREKAFEIQERSDMLVVLTWNTHKEQGILTGKFLEYLQVQKPIIALTSGDLPDGELTYMIRELNLGIACEYVSYKTDYFKLKNYILNQYNLKIVNSELYFSPDYEKMQEFHYEKIVTQLADIMDLIMKSN